MTTLFLRWRTSRTTAPACWPRLEGANRGSTDLNWLLLGVDRVCRTFGRSVFYYFSKTDYYFSKTRTCRMSFSKAVFARPKDSTNEDEWCWYASSYAASKAPTKTKSGRHSMGWILLL